MTEFSDELQKKLLQKLKNNNALISHIQQFVGCEPTTK